MTQREEVELTCWMCEEPRFRSVCTHQPTRIRPSGLEGAPLLDPRPRLRSHGHERN